MTNPLIQRLADEAKRAAGAFAKTVFDTVKHKDVLTSFDNYDQHHARKAAVAAIDRLAEAAEALSREQGQDDPTLDPVPCCKGLGRCARWKRAECDAAATPAQDMQPVAWQDPITEDVITAARKSDWLSHYGAGGRSKAENYTVPLGYISTASVESRPCPSCAWKGERCDGCPGSDPQPKTERQGADSSGVKWRKVPFLLGNRRYEVRCPDAPSLTATGLQIKTAASIPANYQLLLLRPGATPDAKVADGEAVILAADGSTEFDAIPPCTYSPRVGSRC